MFHNVSKVVLRDKRNTFASFSEDELHFSWRTQHFGHFAWQAQHFRRVVLRVFLRVVMSGLRQVVTTCKFGRRLGFCEM
jgi:UDP-N-acetylenolpyruvoylglucosamine reductase